MYHHYLTMNLIHHFILTNYISSHKIVEPGDYMFGLGTQEIVLVLIILLLLFGSNKLPELARSLGLSVREFKKAMKEIEEPTDED
jgi:sec-independent protein translocase protein TatA